MAFPVLITVVGLGAGWVALSHARTKAADPKAGASTDAQAVDTALQDHAGDPTSGNPEGGSPDTTTGTGEGGIAPDPNKSTGADPSTSPTEGFQSNTGITLAGLAPTPGSPDTLAPRQMYGGVYGSMKGVGTKQQSTTLKEFGPGLGMVW